MAAEITLRHTSDGTPYVRPYLGRSPITGKQVRPYREFPGMTDAEALRAAEEWRDSIASTYERDAQRTGSMLDRYIDGMQAQARSFNTIKTYRLYVRRYAAPIARTPVSSVTPQILDELFLELLISGPRGGKPLSPSTVKKFREFLKGAFRYFLGLGLIGSNPVTDTMPIRAMKGEAHALDEADVQALKRAIGESLSSEQDTDMGIMRRNAAMGILLALCTGARVGEVCAIRRRDVRLTALGGSISINGNVVERDGAAVRQNHTKGKKPRNVSIDNDTAEALRAHMDWQKGYLGTCDRNTPICTVDGSHMKPSALSGQFRRYRSTLGLDPQATMHSLRHTHATMLLTNGIDIQTVSERLGHAQVSTTLNTYAHVMEGRDRGAADTFGRLMEGL